MTIEVEPLCGPTPDAVRLLQELDDTLDTAYEPDQRHGLSLKQLFKPGIRFFIARLHGMATGCGAVAFLGEYAEVKRMYVREHARGRALAKALLRHIEAEARGAGFRSLRLETGIHQIAAIGLYKNSGFRRRGPFGHYADLPPHRIAASLFFEKPL